jgi:hypothetical protein
MMTMADMTTTMKSAAIDDDEIDRDLARMTSQGLSMGPSVVTSIDDSTVPLPKKLLHPGLYCCSMRDISMDTAPATATSSSAASKKSPTRSSRNRARVERGVPGFPDFPDFWIGGATPSDRRLMNNMTSSCGERNDTTNNINSDPPTSRRNCSTAQLKRQAVNMYGIKSAFTTMAISSKAIKKAKRDERKLRRIEKIAQLRERRRRKRDMGEICRVMGLIKCD